jgi:phosphoglycolate phosphatase-like HAD superfamily hydrolase
MAEKETKVIAFDFDGVIGDSVYECYVQSLKGFKDLGGKVTDSKDVEQTFRKARPFVKVAEDYVVVLRMIEANPKIDFDSVSQKEFDEAKNKYKEDFQKFKEKFMGYRTDMQKKDEVGWFKLQKDFPSVVSNVNKLIEKGYKVVIATTKEKGSIVKLLKQYKCNIKDEDIISKEIFEDKSKQIKFIALKYDVPKEKIVFIDDMIEQIKIVQKTGAQTAMADWGYSTKKQRDEARLEGVPMVEKEQLYNTLNEMAKDPTERLVIAILIFILALILLNAGGIIHLF